jgi:2-keto-3-deoxy-L-rhamnonate aldolase RhmA
METPEALENAERIAAIPGVDALFLGPDDIMLRRGYAMDAPRTKETLGKDMEIVMQACRKHGKVGVMVGMSPEILTLSASMGFQMIVGGGDVAFLATTSKQAAAASRATLQGVKPSAKAGTTQAASPY